jgi:hypothetical protein
MTTAADNGGGVESRLTALVGNLETACADAKGHPCADGARINLGAGNLADVTLTPGVHDFDVDVNLNANVTHAGSAKDIFIVQTAASSCGPWCDLVKRGTCKKRVVTGRGPGHGGHGFARGRRPFGEDRHFVCDWFLP